MTSLNISLPESMRAWVDAQVACGQYGTASELVRELIREAQRRNVRADLEAKLKAGLDSGPARELTPSDWKKLKRAVQPRSTKRKRA